MSLVGGSISNEASKFAPWKPEAELRSSTVNELRFGRGFLRADPAFWFASLSEYWSQLFRNLDVADFQVVSVLTGLDFPDQLDRITPVEIDGELAVLAADRQSYELITEAVLPELSNAAGTFADPRVSQLARDVVGEYLERRLLSALTLSWTGGGALPCSYITNAVAESVEVVGAITINLIIHGRECSIHFGIGPRVLDRLDLSWRTWFVNAWVAGLSLDGGAPISDSIGIELDDNNSVSLELVELAVPPSKFLDYVRSGATVNLETPVSDRAVLKINNERVAVVQLLQFNGRFAAEIIEFISPEDRSSKSPTGSVTRMNVQVAETELDRDSLIEHLQLGALLVTRSALAPHASLVVSGEDVRDAVIGQINGQFALNILPK